MIPLCPSCGSAKNILAAGPDCGDSDPPITVGLTWICGACNIYFDWQAPHPNEDPDWWFELCEGCGHRITAHRGSRDALSATYPCEFCDCVLTD